MQQRSSISYNLKVFRYVFLLSDAQARGVRQYKFSICDPNAWVGIGFNHQVAIQLGIIDQRREMCGRRNGDSAFNHTSEHYLEPMRTSYVDHLKCLTQPTTLHQLDIDTIHTIRQTGNIGDSDAAFVGKHRHWRVLAHQSQSLQISGIHWLFDELDAIGSYLLNDANSLLGCPASVRIHANSCPRHFAYSANDFQIVIGT